MPKCTPSGTQGIQAGLFKLAPPATPLALPDLCLTRAVLLLAKTTRRTPIIAGK
jgi:hypothetical protein